LAIKRADLVIENGGGYDDFMDQLRDASGSGAGVINAVDVGALHSDNEHVWYDFPTVARVAARVEAFLVVHDRAHAAAYRANARAFMHKLRALEAEESRIKAGNAGAGVAITEPVPLYMLSACGLVNRTPTAFSKAVEDGTDVSPRILQETLALFTAHRVKALVYNTQTGGAATDEVVSAAKAAGVPVVPVTETLPSGKTYLTWMRANLGTLAAALGSTS
jgi:zinc/manganese transport system substrate-binding protein